MNAPANVTRLVFELIGCDTEIRVIGFTGEEEISGLFSFTLNLVCENDVLDVGAFLSKPGLLTFIDSHNSRVLHGEIIQASYVNRGRRFTQFSVMLAPKPWFLLSRSGNRIFQQQSVPDIISTLLSEADIRGSDVRLDLRHSYPARDYTVQYQENEWDFICRLMEEEGIFYFFEHNLDKHTLVLGDHNACFAPLPGSRSIAYHPITGLVAGQESIHAMTLEETIAAGKVSLQDFFFEKPSLSLMTNATVNNPGARADLEQYYYPGNYQHPTEGKRYASLRAEALNTFTVLAEASTSSQRFMPGYVIGVEGHPRVSINRDYLITKVTHEGRQPQSLEEGASTEAYSYLAKLTFIPNDVIYRPARVHPIPYIAGTETAVVTGPAGEEIYTDAHGRIKLHFHWDRKGGYDEKSSCWVRVSQGAAGGQWGSMSIPRVGEEVIVAYESGHPDRPVVIGRTYHGQHPSPYPLPANKTRSTLKTLSTPNGGGFNEVRIEDKKSSEQIFIHAEKDVDVKVKNHWRETIENDEHTKVEKESFTKVEKDHHKTVDGQHNVSVGKSQSLQVGKDSQIKTTKNYNMQAQEIHLKAGMQLVIEAGSEVVMKAGSGLITLNPSGVTIKGAMVKINSGGGGGGAKSASPQAPTAPEPPA
ncbi:hypothetical protein A9Q99_24610 [Gammaproteobacteria bacterium 45_16_T64]|nr:hypothetical protein A9Q99_24610 [Gammaproteobacteria bacterium 45_16_T64]